MVILASGTRVPLEEGKEYYVGSGSSVHVKLSARDVSGVHAVLTVSHNAIRVVDLGSKNGTFYNGRKVTTADVANGETVAFSSVKVQFVKAQGEGEAPLPKPFLEKETSHTGEFPVAAPEGDLGALIGHWDLAPEKAYESLLAWIVGQRQIPACALLQRSHDQVSVLAAQGHLPPGLIANPALSALLARPAVGPWEARQMPKVTPPAFVCPIDQDQALLIVTGRRLPSSQELELFGRLARIAFRLAGI